MRSHKVLAGSRRKKAKPRMGEVLDLAAAPATGFELGSLREDIP